jgi:hypothetical protein
MLKPFMRRRSFWRFFFPPVPVKHYKINNRFFKKTQNQLPLLSVCNHLSHFSEVLTGILWSET